MTHDLQKGFTKIGNALRGLQWVYTQIVEEKRKGAFTYPIFFWGGLPSGKKHRHISSFWSNRPLILSISYPLLEDMLYVLHS